MSGPFVLPSLFFLALHFHLSSGQTSWDVSRLRTELFVTNAYDKRIRPQIDQSYATRIYINFHLLALNEVNAVEETLRLTAYLQLKWLDEFLAWTPSNYGELQSYHWPQDEVWKPVIALRNSYLDYKALGDETLAVSNSHHGVIVWMPFQVFTSTCSMVITYYPFDKQICHVRFVAWGYTKNEVVMAGGDRGIVLDEYEANPQWELLDSSWTVTYGTTDVTITFTMTMKRVPSYVIFTVLLPILFLTMLNIFVFVLPCESGERVGYAVTVFLSFAVFFTLISGVLPESISLFTIYVIVMTAQSALICLIAIVQVRMSCHDDSERPVPKWLVAMENIGHCKVFRRLKCKKNKKSVSNETPVMTFTLKDKQIKGNNDDRTNETGDESDDNYTDDVTWKSAISGLDYVMMFVFSTLSVIGTAVCIGMCASAE